MYVCVDVCMVSACGMYMCHPHALTMQNILSSEQTRNAVSLNQSINELSQYSGGYRAQG